MRVLIVEDEPYLAEAIRDGLRMKRSSDGDTAVGLFSVNSYDLAVPMPASTDAGATPGQRAAGVITRRRLGSRRVVRCRLLPDS
jgi:hypothetical protein